MSWGAFKNLYIPTIRFEPVAELPRNSTAKLDILGVSLALTIHLLPVAPGEAKGPAVFQTIPLVSNITKWDFASILWVLVGIKTVAGHPMGF
jgi:hypothetical protein